MCTPFRFHLLGEFDDGKRSCRKRLAGHNQRRRKPQVGIHSGRGGRLLQSYNGINEISSLIGSHESNFGSSNLNSMTTSILHNYNGVQNFIIRDDIITSGFCSPPFYISNERVTRSPKQNNVMYIYPISYRVKNRKLECRGTRFTKQEIQVRVEKGKIRNTKVC